MTQQTTAPDTAAAYTPIPTTHQPDTHATYPHPDVSIGQWLVNRRNAGDTPDRIAGDLVAHGWSADLAASTAIRSLRRTDRQALLWFALCWSAGLAAVGFTTAAHQLLAPTGDRAYAALALTVALVMLPVAGVCLVWAHRVEQSSPHAVWSPERRIWFGVLATCTATVGLVRLVTYLYAIVHTVIVDPAQPLLGQDLLQVGVSLGVAIPLFAWSFTAWRRSDVAISGLVNKG